MIFLDLINLKKIRRAVIDRNTLIPAGTQIGIDPEADRQRFTVTENGIVLVTPEMLGQEVHSIR